MMKLACETKSLAIETFTFSPPLMRNILLLTWLAGIRSLARTPLTTCSGFVLPSMTFSRMVLDSSRMEKSCLKYPNSTPGAIVRRSSLSAIKLARVVLPLPFFPIRAVLFPVGISKHAFVISLRDLKPMVRFLARTALEDMGLLGGSIIMATWGSSLGLSFFSSFSSLSSLVSS